MAALCQQGAAENRHGGGAQQQAQLTHRVAQQDVIVRAGVPTCGAPQHLPALLAAQGEHLGETLRVTGNQHQQAGAEGAPDVAVGGQ